MFVLKVDYGLVNSIFYIGVDFGMLFGFIIGGLISS